MREGSHQHHSDLLLLVFVGRMFIDLNWDTNLPVFSYFCCYWIDILYWWCFALSNYDCDIIICMSGYCCYKIDICISWLFCTQFILMNFILQVIIVIKLTVCIDAVLHSSFSIHFRPWLLLSFVDCDEKVENRMFTICVACQCWTDINLRFDPLPMFLN